jgi:transposase
VVSKRCGPSAWCWGFSKYLYVGWSRRIRASDFFRHHRRALETVGGVPQTCVYDNLKPVVVRHTRTEVLFAPPFLGFLACMSPLFNR